jgi:FAD:protein FMN transferase
MRLKVIGFIILITCTLASCSQEQKKINFQGSTQGTYYSITYFDKKERNFQPQVDSILKAFDLSVSLWNPNSIISRINRDEADVQPDTWFLDIFKLAQQIAENTNGAFDCTVGPLVNAWGFGFKGKIRMGQAKVDSLLKFVDYRKVSLDAQNRIIKPAFVKLDFNAIAQGYSVDLISKYLESKGIKNYLVDIGGEVRGKGKKPDGKSWMVGIENPSADSISESTINSMVRLENKAVSTSGSYRKYYEENGVRYSHTIDPKTGYPVRHSLLSVSVMADNCATADGYATAFMVMGYEKSKEFLENQTGMEVFFIVGADNGIYQTFATKGFESYIIQP